MSHGDDGDLTRPARRLFDLSPAHPSLPAGRMCFSTATLFRVMSARHYAMVGCVGPWTPLVQTYQQDCSFWASCGYAAIAALPRLL